MTIWEVFALIAGIIGLVGSIVPGIPGPPISWVGLLLLLLGHCGQITLTAVLVWLAVTVLVTILDYVVPIWTTKWTGGHNAASKGALIGLFAGLLFTPVGMIGGSFIGAVIGELSVNHESLGAAIKAGAGAFLGFILSTGLKAIASAMMFYCIVKFIVA